MPTPRRKWITDPKALDTICALGLPIGSEVKLDQARTEEIDIFTNYPDAVWRVVPIDAPHLLGRAYSDQWKRRKKLPQHRLIAEVHYIYREEWYISREVVKAWRPAKFIK